MLSISDYEIAKDVAVPFLSALVGAFAGFVPSWLLARRASAEQSLKDRETLREIQLFSARRAFVKLSALANGIGSFHNQIEEMACRPDMSASGTPFWRKLSTFAGIEREPSINFSAKELSVFISARCPAYVDDLMLLARKYNAILSDLTMLCKMKSDLHYWTAEHGTTVRDKNGVSSTLLHLSPDTKNLFRVKSEELDLFANATRETVRKNFEFAMSVARQFTETVDSYFGKNDLPYLEPMSEEGT